MDVSDIARAAHNVFKAYAEASGSAAMYPVPEWFRLTPGQRQLACDRISYFMSFPNGSEEPGARTMSGSVENIRMELYRVTAAMFRPPRPLSDPDFEDGRFHSDKRWA